MPAVPAAHAGAERLRVHVRGSVQGVGFRPFVHRLAGELGLAGSVRNLCGGVRIDVEGEERQVRTFLSRLTDEFPVGAHIEGVDTTVLPARGTSGFEITASAAEGSVGPLPLDAATCVDCLAELFAPGDRRYRYPFLSCSVCGPRYSILDGLPYDRSRTSMRSFSMCPACEAEYADPWDRRFHAQTNCCPACGPRLSLWDARGGCLADEEDALVRAALAVSEGAVVAVKGLGGFQLIVDAGDPRAVGRLRERKGRPEKPFAVLVRDLAGARDLCDVSVAEASTLGAAAAPIVLLERRSESRARIAAGVAPENPDLGVMLPATPLHHLLMEEVRVPVVVTSGNRSGDPICHVDAEAVSYLDGIADLFLVHDRPIAHPIDDSVVRVFRGRPRVLRAARGFAPLSVPVAGVSPGVVGWGAYLKNTVAVSDHDGVRLSPHIGDRRSSRSQALARRTVKWLGDLQAEEPTRSAVDLYPAGAGGSPEEVLVQHHYAHVLAGMAEHGVTDSVLGIAWDGNGYGPDGTIWGGEFLVCDRSGFERVAHLRTFPLPGAERAIREGRRAAIGLLHELRGPRALHDLELAPVRSFHASERRTMSRMLQRGLNCPRTSSVGRLFDAVASLTDLRQKTTFEGQAAMALEFSARGRARGAPYSFALRQQGPGRPLVADWGPVLHTILRDIRAGRSTGWISRCFHEGLADLVVRMAERVGRGPVLLTGGCFQNQLLLACTTDRLRAAGFEPIYPQRIPPNDGGLALGQVVHAATVDESGREG